jgi:2',3'-cyclic-nucleotide 2'-phosphodiesterase / 3'-nucleotidase / 5'-nucleotidase
MRLYYPPMLPLIAALVLTAPIQDTAHVVLVATTDIHGHVTDWNYAKERAYPGGLTRVATVVDSLKARYPGQVVVLDAGDLLQGDPFATYFARVKPHDPHPVIEAMNLVGYDVATPGNHDFDWGLPAMRRAISAAAFPYVSGNIYSLGGDTLLYPAFTVLHRQAVRIGVAGFTTPGVMLWDRDEIEGKVRVERIPAAAARTLAAMRRQVDLAVVLIHSGMEEAASYDTTGIGGENVAMSLAAMPIRPDLVVVGHTHREMRDSVLGGVHFVQPKPYGGSVSVTHIDLVKEAQRWRLARVRSDLVSTGAVLPSARVSQRSLPAHRAVLAWINTPIGQASGPLPAAAARAEPTAILNFINAVQRKRTGAQLSAASAFDLEAGLDSGDITIGQVAALYPYDNTLRAVRVTGGQVKAYLEHSARYFWADAAGRITINDSIPGYNFDVLAGARYDVDLRRPVGDRIVNLTVRGRVVDPAETFTLAVNSYRQSGAGGYAMLQRAPVVYDKAENIRDLLIQEIRAHPSIDPADYGAREWRIVPEGIATAVKALFRISPPPPVEETGDIILLRIFATTDLNGALLPKPDQDGEPAGGMAVISGMLDSLTAECRCPTLRLDAGDAMQGTVIANLTHGRAMVDVLNRMEIGAAALGEHDFEWSLDTLRRRLSESRYPWLAANVFDAETGRRPDWIVPYRVLEGGGLKVAVVGYITSDTKARLKPALTSGLRFGDGVLPIHDVLAEVRSGRPDLTILLAHAGASCQGAACSGEVIRLAEGLEPRTVDLMIAGHTPLVNTRVSGVPIVSGGTKGSAIVVADVVRTPAGGREVRARIQPVRPGQVTATAAVAELVEGYRRKADSLTGRTVAMVKFPLRRTGDQHRVGALLAEARRNVLRADLGLVGNDGIRADLPAGPVTYGQLFEIQPSQNGLVKLTLTGARLREVLEQSIDSAGRPVAHVAGVKVRYDPRRRPGRRVQAVELSGGRKLQRDATYTLAVDDFLATGSDGFTQLTGLPAEPGGTLDVEALITYLRRLPQPVAFVEQPGFVSARR